MALYNRFSTKNNNWYHSTEGEAEAKPTWKTLPRWEGGGMEPQAGYRRFQSFGGGKAEEGGQQQLAEECGAKAAGARRGGLRL